MVVGDAVVVVDSVVVVGDAVVVVDPVLVVVDGVVDDEDVVEPPVKAGQVLRSGII